MDRQVSGSRGTDPRRPRRGDRRNVDIRISAKVAGHHGSILRKDFAAVAETVREVAAATAPGVEPSSPPARRGTGRRWRGGACSLLGGEIVSRASLTQMRGTVPMCGDANAGARVP